MVRVSVLQKLVSSALAVALVVQAPMAYAGQDAVVNDVSAQLKRMKGTKSAFCFAVENGAVTGVNEDVPVRVASVMKTLTTFWAVESLPGGPNYQYATTVSVQASNHDVHIDGSRDPFFDRDRLFTLLADLNHQGLTHINRLTVDGNFWFWPRATEIRYLNAGGSGGGRSSRRRHAHSHRSKGRSPAGKYSPRESFVLDQAHTQATIAGDPQFVKRSLTEGFNTAGWSQSLRDRYQRARAMNPVVALPASVTMKTDEVDVVSSNPLKGKPGVVVYVSKSAPIKMFLKEMNIYSINAYAEEIYFSLGGKTALQTFMAKHGFGREASRVNSGSGVNLSDNPKNRGDTYLTCSTVVRYIRLLDLDLERMKLDLTDVMMAPKLDGGTAKFMNSWEDGSGSFVVKTGTLRGVKNLAGVEETTSGEVYFGLFLDGPAGTSYGLREGTTGMKKNFRPVRVAERAYQFASIGSWSHLQPSRG